MRRALNNLNKKITKDHPNYVCRITSDAGKVGKAHLFEFMDKQKQTQVIAVTSKLLTTGVDVPTCKNIVLARVIRSMTDFKQIIGRGTRVCEEYGKTSFTILDYTKSTVLFDDPEFDDEPDAIENEEIDDQAQIFDVPQNGSEAEPLEEEDEEEEEPSGFRGIPEDEEELPSKLFIDTGHEEIVEEVVYELDGDTNRLAPSRLIDHTKEQVRTLYRSTLEIQQRWADPTQRNEIMDMLAERNIDFDELKAVTSQPDADPFDLLCHIVFGSPVLTCRQRAEQLRRQKPDFFEQYGAEAREILETLLDKYSPLGEQRRIVARVEELAGKMEEARSLRQQALEETKALVTSLHLSLAGSRIVRLEEILALDERQEKVAVGKKYPQVGVKGFGGGLFAKEAVDATQTTYKAFNCLYDGAVVLSQVKGWEGAISVCSSELAGRYVSPEYRTFSCIPGQAIPEYLAALVATPWFWTQLKHLTRGMGGRRERTRPEQFLRLEIPMPTIDQQKKAIAIFQKVDAIKPLREGGLKELDAMLPSILDKAFKG
jgi:hypothetical protein